MGAWTLATDNYSGTAGLLAATSSSKNYLGVVASPGNNGKWEISFSDQKASFTAKGTYTRNVMQYNYNNGSPIFACYASATQSACYLYHKSSGSGETTNYTVHWMVGGEESTTTKVASGSKATPPTPPADNALSCANTFMGWSKQNLGSGTGKSDPGDLFKDEPPEAITGETTFYAVFATKKSGN